MMQDAVFISVKGRHAADGPGPANPSGGAEPLGAGAGIR